MDTKTNETSKTLIDTMEKVHNFVESKGIAKGVLTEEQAIAICRASSDVTVKIAKPEVVGTKEYKGNKLIEITGNGRPFSFGKSKAMMIVRNFDKIKELAEELYQESENK